MTSTALAQHIPPLQKEEVQNEVPDEVKGIKITNGKEARLTVSARGEQAFRHVVAYHSRPRASCLSRDATSSSSFLGFRNLMVLVLGM